MMFQSIAQSAAPILAAIICVHAFPEAVRSLQYDPAILQALGAGISPPKNDTSFTCNALEIALGNATVSVADGETYTDLEDVNYSSNCRLPAGCIVSPVDAQQVARVIKIVSSLDTKFAVRSGGHKGTPGFASIPGYGVLISLGSLNTISIADDRETVTVGSGNRWIDVYDAVVPQGLVVIGGRAAPVGVGGFLLGGGVSYFLNEYGLGMDNIKSFEVVLGDGSIVTASSSTNSDLFRGLRGGGSNFGIVTAFELYAYAQGQVHWEGRAYSPSQDTEVLEAFASYQLGDGELDRSTAIALQIRDTGPLLLLFYSKPAASPSAFDAFYNISSYTAFIPPSNGTLLELMAQTGTGLPETEIRLYGETFSHEVDAAFMLESYNIFLEEIANLPANASGTWLPMAVSDSVATNGQQNGGNVIGLSAIHQQWHEWFLTWSDASQDEEIYAIADTITSKLVAAAKANNLFLPYVFTNTAGTNQDVLGSFGPSNVQIIKDVAAKYDPDQVFQRLQNDGYLVRKL